MFNALTKKIKAKRGFTLMEVLVVVGVIAIVCGIAISGIMTIRDNLAFRQKNDYAKSIFMAAQTRLTEMRATSGLKQIEALSAEHKARLESLDNPETEKVEYQDYRFTASRDSVYSAAYNLILPVGAVDSTIRDQHVIIEFNPKTGNVYSVYYSETDATLINQYQTGRLPRNAEGDEELRKEMMLGYYDGSDLSSEELGLMNIKADITFDNGEEALVTVIVPTQDDSHFSIAEDGNYNRYMTGLAVKLTIVGEMGGVVEKEIKAAGDFNPLNCYVSTDAGGANVIHIVYPIDSLVEGGSFANLAAKDGVLSGNSMVNSIISEAQFNILPGDNVTITAQVTYEPSPTDPIVEIEDAMIAGVNPMFDSLTTGSSADKYILTVSNGRNLQNLNLLAPSIAQKVESVIFVKSNGETENIIDWNDTVEYYNSKYGTNGSYPNAASIGVEAPARALPYFVPIMNSALLNSATIQGNEVQIINLSIDASRYLIPNVSYYAVGAPVTYENTGLFSVLNTRAGDISIINPIIRGGSGTNPATGALAGAIGPNAELTNCGAYIKTEDLNFVRTDLNMKDFTGYDGEGSTSVANSQYGVSGMGSVGGLVGYAATNKTVKNCFAAIPVYGKHVTSDFNGFGGLVGFSSSTSYQQCYASGTVRAYVTDDGYGAGGFVGTSSDSNYTNCFASGDVSTQTGSEGCAGFIGVIRGASATIRNCYSVGLSSLEEDFIGFVHSGTTVETGKSNYYLSQTESETERDNDVSKLYAEVKIYDFMEDLTSTKNAGYPTTVWGEANILGTHAYDIALGNNRYPFTMLKNMDYYGNWPRKPLDAGIAYYELYDTDRNGTADKLGFYFDRDKTSTLSSEYTVLSDGYMILAGTESDTVTITGINSQTKNIKLSPPDEAFFNETTTIDVDGKQYAIFLLSLADDDISGSSFYNTINVEIETVTEDVTNGQTTITTDYHFFYNPNVALSHINPANSTAPTSAPSQIFIRTARQLAAVGRNMANFWDENYVQQLDIDFTTYQNGSSLKIAPIGNGTVNFTGSYIGRKDDGTIPTIIGYKPADSANSGIFGVIGENGVVRNLNLSIVPQKNQTTLSGGGSQTSNIGLLAGTNNGAVEKVNMVIDGTVELKANNYAGLLVGVNGGQLVNCHVSQTSGTATLNAPVAGGFAGSVTGGSMSNVSVTLNKLSGTGDLAGVFGTISAGASISDVPFRFTGSYASITSSHDAAGFVGTSYGNLNNCSVRGEGTISATDRSAGFALTVNNGTIDGCTVSPAMDDEDYAGNSNGNLTISGSAAAGFVVENNAKSNDTSSNGIRNCTALGTVKGSSSAGFVLTNNGEILYSMSNTDMVSGTVFAGTNNGSVEACYGWASGGTVDQAPNGKVTYVSCYFGIIDSEKNVVLFDFSGTAANYPTATLSQATVLNKLTGGSRSVWSSGASFDAYPYDTTNLKAYPYPMLREHYGDWPTPSNAYEYGVVYYEKYDNGTAAYEWAVDLVNMTDIAEDSIAIQDKDTLKDSTSVTVTDAGYALFCKIGTTPFSDATNALIGNLMTDSALYTAAGIDSTIYGLYELDYSRTDLTQNPVISVYNLNGTGSVELIPLFADTLNSTSKTYRIRTQKHLENIRMFPGETYLIDRCVCVGSNFSAIPTFSGTLSGAEGAVLTLNGLTDNLIQTMDHATFEDCTIVAGSSGEPRTIGLHNGLIGTAKDSTIQNITLNAVVSLKPAAESASSYGVLVNSAEKCTITNCTLTVDVKANYTASEAAAVAETEESTPTTITKGNLTIGGIVGLMNGGSLEYSTVQGSITFFPSVGDYFDCVVGGALGTASKSGSTYATVYNVQAAVSIDPKFSGTNQTGTNTGSGLYISSHGCVGEFVGFIEGGSFTLCSAQDSSHPYEFFGGIQAASETMENITHYRNASSSEMLPVGNGSGTTVMVYHFDHVLFDNCSGDNGMPHFEEEKYFYNNTGANASYQRTDTAVSVTAESRTVSADAMKTVAETNGGVSDYFILENGTYYRVTVQYNETTGAFTFLYGIDKTMAWSPDGGTALYDLSINLTDNVQYTVLTEDQDYAVIWADSTASIATAPPYPSVNAQMICTASGNKLKVNNTYFAEIQIPDIYTPGAGVSLIVTNSDNQQFTLSADGSREFLIYEAFQTADATSYKCVFAQN